MLDQIRYMPKSTLLWLAIGSFALAFLAVMTEQGTCLFIFAVGGIGCGGWWYFKQQRDNELAEQGKTLRVHEASSVSKRAPAMTSEGSGRLYVPEPYNQRH